MPTPALGMRFLAVIAVAAACIPPATIFAGEAAAPRTPVPMLHVSDLFRPHNDPDDHWDLACAYALAYTGDAELLGIFIDYPQPERRNDPDVQAVAQMNYLTGKAVPIMVGAPRRIAPGDAAKRENQAALRGVRLMLDALRKSPRPVVISILGSCRDVAIAGQLEPELFAKKCAAIYLNAGSGTPDKELAKRLEWNVQLDPASYGAIFSLPCPVYWMPCFEVVPARGEPFRVDAYGTFYRFRQGDVLPDLSDGLQNFFAYVFKQARTAAPPATGDIQRPEWLHFLVGAKDLALHGRVAALQRNMWCTGGFLHAAGKTVARDGQIVALAGAKDPLFTFDPIRVSCTAEGLTHWQAGASVPPRFIFHVRDQQRYPAAMTAALRALLAQLP